MNVMADQLTVIETDFYVSELQMRVSLLKDEENNILIGKTNDSKLYITDFLLNEKETSYFNVLDLNKNLIKGDVIDEKGNKINHIKIADKIFHKPEYVNYLLNEDKVYNIPVSNQNEYYIFDKNKNDNTSFYISRLGNKTRSGVGFYNNGSFCLKYDKEINGVVYFANKKVKPNFICYKKEKSSR